MSKNKWFLLQLFAGEGDGAGASGSGEGGNSGSDGTTGDNGLDAEAQRLRELGVPEDKLKRRAKGTPAKLPEGAVRTVPMEQQAPQQQVATATENPTEEQTGTKDGGKPEDATPKRMTWKEIMADPEYNTQMQETIRARLKSAGAAQEALETLSPALEMIARKYGMDPEKLDYAELAKKVSEDDAYYEDRAMELGVSVETARRMDQQDREQKNAERKQFQAHFAQLEQQGEALKKVFPGFDLRTELQNPAFARMTAPGTGIMSVEDAYRAVHRKEIEAEQSRLIAERTAQSVSNAIQAGARRPDENGTSGQSASVTTFDYSKASREQREALKQQIRAAAARGEKLYPGR